MYLHPIAIHFVLELKVLILATAVIDFFDTLLQLIQKDFSLTWIVVFPELNLINCR